MKRFVLIFIALVIFTIYFTYGASKSGVIFNSNIDFQTDRELHNWKKVSNGKYEVYNMFYDEYDNDGNLIQDRNYYRYMMDKNGIEENDMLNLSNVFEDLISNETKFVLDLNVKNYYKKIYTQAEFMKLTKTKLEEVSIALNDVYEKAKFYMATLDDDNNSLNDYKIIYHYIHANLLLSKWTIDNYNENLHSSINSLKNYNSQFIDICKYYKEFKEDYALINYDPDTNPFGFSRITYYEYEKNIGNITINDISDLKDNAYYEFNLSTNIRVALEYSLIDELKVDDEIKIYKYKKGTNDNEYYTLVYKGIEDFDDVFYKKEQYLQGGEYYHPGYEHYRNFFTNLNINKFAKFKAINTEEPYEYNVDDNRLYDYVGIREGGFSAPLFCIGYIGAQLYESPFEYELFYDRNFISSYNVKVLKNALNLTYGGDIDDCITCFIGNELNDKLELIDNKLAMEDIEKLNIKKSYEEDKISYVTYDNKNYLTCLVNVAHSESDIPSSYGQFNKPKRLVLYIEKDAKVYQQPDETSEIVYIFKEKVDNTDDQAIDENGNPIYHFSVKNNYTNVNNENWFKIFLYKGQVSWEECIGWIKTSNYEIVDDVSEYYEWYQYS